MKNNLTKIAIVRVSALGDIINSAVVLQFIHKRYPEIKIDWITEEVFAPLLQNHPLIDRVHTINLKKLKKEKSLSKLYQTVKKLKNLADYDLVIDMQGLIKSAIISRLISSHVHGFDKNSSREALSSLFYKSTTDIIYDANVIKRNTFLIANALDFEINEEMIINKEPIFEYEKYHNLNYSRKNIAIVIGASWESKKYPKENIVKLCEELKESATIIWGSEVEKEDALWIAKNSNFATIAPKLNLNELISLISSVDLLIGNDTGPTHLAWAQNIASITLFGPTTTRMIYETDINVGIKSPSKVDIFKIDKNDFSIKDIDVDEIIIKAKELLN